MVPSFIYLDGPTIVRNRGHRFCLSRVSPIPVNYCLGPKLGARKVWYKTREGDHVGRREVRTRNSRRGTTLLEEVRIDTTFRSKGDVSVRQ